MNGAGKGELIEKVEGQRRRRSEILRELQIPRSTYYHWRKAYEEEGLAGLERGRSGGRIWNRLLAGEVERVSAVARLHPELSLRLLAVKITDEEDFAVSESTVYRILKEKGLIYPRPLGEMPAQKQWRHKTTRPDELWQCDATNLFVVGWGYYKLIPVEDDFARKIIAHDVRPDETGYTLSDILEMGLENARKEGHLTGNEPMPRLYSDNGSGFTSNLLAGPRTSRSIMYLLTASMRGEGRRF
jgi:putative transposase